MATATKTKPAEPKFQPAKPAFPDTNAEIAKQRQARPQYVPPRPGDKLPFEKCNVTVPVPTDSLKESVANHAADVAAIANRYQTATKLEDVDPSDIDIASITRERDRRREAVLTALQDAYGIIDSAVRLCEEIAEAWSKELSRLQTEDEKIRRSTEKSLRKLYPSELDAPFRGRLNTSEPVVKSKRAVQSARDYHGRCKARVNELETTKLQIAAELKQLVDHYRN